jgi:hypothetical protein
VCVLLLEITALFSGSTSHLNHWIDAMGLWVLLSSLANMPVTDVFELRSYERILTIIIDFAGSLQILSDVAKKLK